MDDYYHKYNLISKILLSVDCILINNVLQPLFTIKVLLTYDIDKIFNLLKIYVTDNVEINNIDKFYNIITIKFKEEKEEFNIYCFNYSLSKYIYNSSESLFDCNLIYTKFDTPFLSYDQFHITHDDLITRRNNRKFCYLAENFINLEYFLLNGNKLCNILRDHFFNKLTYAYKLIMNGWVMDEFYLKNKSWTINYWANYVKHFSLIKLNNDIYNDILNDTHCHICKNDFIDTNIVLNISDNYIHYDCIINKLYNQ
jgi:hypothetical protein|tara:strand:- start:1924 stop:2688 length:765 start_codon:yes stop_codon:yes gene_type:complete